MTASEAHPSALPGHAAMLLFAALIAAAFSLGKEAAPFVDPVAFTALRFLCAAAVMGAVLLATRTRVRRRDTRAPWRYLVLGALIGGYFILMFEALKTAPPVTTSALFTLIPAMSAAFGWLLLRQSYTPVALAALLVGAVGAVWVIFEADWSAFLAFDLGRGEKLFFLGCVAHALYTPMVPKLHRSEPILVFSFGTILGALGIVGLYALPAIAATDWMALPVIVWITVAYLAIFTTAGTFALLQFAALRLPSGKVMAYGYLVPAFVAFYEGLLGNGWPAPMVWAGVALICAALLILLFGRD